jgi:hypothetical protein
MPFGVCRWLCVSFVHWFVLLIGLVLHTVAESTSAHIIIGHVCKHDMVCGGALNPTELCFIVRSAGLRLEILILILC